MKRLSITFLSTGIIVLIVLILRIFGAFKIIITLDIQWFMLLFGGLLFSCIGFLLDEITKPVYNEYQKQQKRAKIRYMCYAISGIFGCMILCFFASK